MQTICPKTKAQIFMEKNKKFKTMSQFASTFFSFSYFTNSHKLLLKKQKTKNKKQKTHKSKSRFPYNCRYQITYGLQDSIPTKTTREY